MNTATRKRRVYAKPPASGAARAWRTVVRTGSWWTRFRAADILIAWEDFQGVDDALADDLRRALLRCFDRRVAKWLGNARYGREHHYWLMREDDFTTALLKPQSELGKALRKSFVNFADWGTVDLVRDDLKHTGEVFDDEKWCGSDESEGRDAKIDLEKARKSFAAGNEKKIHCLVLQELGFSRSEITKEIGVARETQIAWRENFDAFKLGLGLG